MDTMPYKLLIADTENSALLLIDGETGKIQGEWPLPREYTPLDICLSSDGNIAYIPANSTKDRGALFIFSADAGLSQLPLELSAIERLAVGLTPERAIFTTRDGALMVLDTITLNISQIGCCGMAANCVGLAADQKSIYTIWQIDGAGVLAVFTPAGELLTEQSLPGLPTSLSQSEHYLYVPFTTSCTGDEGMLLLHKDLSTPPATIRLNTCLQESAFRIYPCYVAVAPDESLAYVVHEESVNISVIEIAPAAVIGHIPVGRSISSLILLPDAKFAIAGSNMFADLSLIDLVNRRLLSLTNGDREIGQVAILS